MSSYTNTHILECNRLHSPQYQESENTAVWTNAVSDGLKLDIGDTVSLHSAFVSDLGAEDSTIEFKGDIIQNSQTFDITVEENIETFTFNEVVNNASITRPRYYLQSKISSSSITIDNIKDTDVNIEISYFKSNNGEYMFHLPLKFALPSTITDTDQLNSWIKSRDHTVENTGMARAPSASHRYAADYTYDSTNKVVQLNVDGSRFMIFGRDVTYFDKLNGSNAVTIAYDGIRFRDIFINTTKYLRIKDLLQLEAPVGFNSPSQIANIITEQLQKQTDVSQNTINYYVGDRLVKKSIGNKNQTATNKLFSCATFKNLSKPSADAYFGTTTGVSTGVLPTNAQAAFDYESAYQYIGIKRPEIYETGTDVKLIINDLDTFDRIGTTDTRFLFIDYRNPLSTSELNITYLSGVTEKNTFNSLDNVNIANYDYVHTLPFGLTGVNDDTELLSIIHTNIPFNASNLNKLKDFFEAQTRYPELFDMNADGNELLYNKSINNASIYAGEEINATDNRFIHIGSHRNSQQARIINVALDASGTVTAGAVSFGYDNIPSVFSLTGASYGGVNTSGVDFSSAPLFINFDDSQKDNIDDIDNFPYYDINNPTWNIWGGFAVRTPPSLVVKDSGTAMSLNYISNAKDIDPTGYSDNISFLAVVPKPYLISKTLKTYHNSDGSASTTIQSHQVNTLGYVEWYEKILDPLVYGANKTYVVDDCDAIKVGFDSHPSAYGNAYIGLYNGVCGEKGSSIDNEYSTLVDTNNPANYYDSTGESLDVNIVPKYADEWLNKIYIGAIEPELSFDTTNSRFAISSLHSPERITAKYDASLVKTGTSGSKTKLSQGQVIPVPDNNGVEVYKINKVFDRRNFCPTLTPYNAEVAIDITGTTVDDLFPLPYVNQIIKSNSIIDSNSGIFIENFNILEKNWNNSFWNICGFKYENLNNISTGNINVRVDNNSVGNISQLTTNALVINADLLKWSGTGTGVPAQQYALPKPVGFNLQHTSGHSTSLVVANSPLQVDCDSVKIEASNLPTKTLRPYFVIRSDIISDSYFQGGSNEPSLAPVLSVIPKESQYGDYYYATDTTQFTITYPRTITKITTIITDPSGKTSNLSPNSAVLYKIIKAKASNQNILQQVLQATQPKK